MGRIWFGFANAVAMLDGDRVRAFSGKDGIQMGPSHLSRARGTKIWIGGEFGLEFFDGSRLQPVNLSDGSSLSGVSGIVADLEFWGAARNRVSDRDIRIPGMSGLELQPKLNLNHSPIPTIFMTAHGDEKMRLQAMRGGAVKFLMKPFDGETLLDAIRVALKH